MNEHEQVGIFCRKYFTSIDVERPHTVVTQYGYGTTQLSIPTGEAIVTVTLTMQALQKLAMIEDEYATDKKMHLKHPAVKEAYDKYRELLMLTS